VSAHVNPARNGIAARVTGQDLPRFFWPPALSTYIGGHDAVEAHMRVDASVATAGIRHFSYILGSRLCPALPVPWNPSDRSPADLESRARALFSLRGYDDAAARILFESPNYGHSTLACWLDPRTAAHIESLNRLKGISVTSVTSLLVAVANRFRKSIRNEDLLVIVEPDHISAFSRGRQASFLLSRACNDPAQLIPELVTRWQLEQSPAEADRIHVFAPLVPVLPELPGIPLQRLHIALLAGADPQLAFCLPAGHAAKR